MRAIKRTAPSTERPALGEGSVLRMMASTSHSELPRFVAAVNLAISQWALAAADEPCCDLDSELARLHALKSITSVLGSGMVASACDDLSGYLQSGAKHACLLRPSAVLERGGYGWWSPIPVAASTRVIDRRSSRPSYR